MAFEVLLPQWGMGMQEGTLLTWHKGVGDTVEEGEPLVEVETAKTTDDVFAPTTGTLIEILVPEGTTVSVGEVLALIVEPGQDEST